MAASQGVRPAAAADEVGGEERSAHRVSPAGGHGGGQGGGQGGEHGGEHGGTLGPADSAVARRAMVESQLMPCGIVEERLVDALLSVPRERFVAPDRAGLAYVEAAQPIAPGRFLPVPLTTARLIARAAIRPGEQVLLLGAGTGYAAAVMAAMGATVIALESEPRLVEKARAALAPWPGVQVIEGPLEAGAPDHAPFDGILIDGGVEAVPSCLAPQLKPTGRAVLVLLGPDGIPRAGIGRRSSAGLSFDWFAETPAPILPAFRKAPAFRF